jgi:hypothetical protein
MLQLRDFWREIICLREGNLDTVWIKLKNYFNHLEMIEEGKLPASSS